MDLLILLDSIIFHFFAWLKKKKKKNYLVTEIEVNLLDLSKTCRIVRTDSIVQRR